MVVVAIIAILGATVVPLIMDRPNEARVVRAQTDIKSLGAALDLYRLDNFNYPSTEQGLQARGTATTSTKAPVKAVISTSSLWAQMAPKVVKALMLISPIGTCNL